MRVARGLFRLWLVLSVLWIGGAGYVTWKDFPASYRVAESKSKTAGFDPDAYLRSLGVNPDALWSFDQEGRAALWSFAQWAFIPPAFMLALGAALVWAFRGFRQ